MATITPSALVQGATRQPLPYGLFSTFTTRPQGDGRWQGGGVQFETLACDLADGIGAWQTPDGTGTVGLPKDLAKLTSALGDYGAASAFTVYGHFQCAAVGWTPERAQEMANQHLLTREENRVEQAFWTGDLGNTPKLQDAGTVTIGAAGAGLAQTIGLLESWIATNYGSVGVIHMTRQAAEMALAQYLLDTSGGRLTTRLGTPVAAGGGYPGTGPTGQAAAASTSWLFATPALFGYRSEVFDSSNRPGDLFDRSANALYAVAERQYLLGFDPCGVAAALATLTAAF
jgi:hypothetical protein